MCAWRHAGGTRAVTLRAGLVVPSG
jgi:hypothetical protein